MSNHIALIENAKSAIGRVFSDNSVVPSDTRESLEELREYINELLESLENKP